MSLISTFLMVLLYGIVAFPFGASNSAEIQLSGKAFIGKFYGNNEFVYEAEEGSFSNDLSLFDLHDKDICASPIIKKHALKFLNELIQFYNDKNLSGLQLLEVKINNSSTELSKNLDCNFWSEDI